MNDTQFAAAIGVSRPTFYKYKREGMPVDSVETATAWVAARQTLDSRRGGKPSSQLLSLKEDLLRANIAKTEAEARLKEAEADVSAKNLVSLDEAKSYVAEILGPLRVLLDSLPKAAAVKANPSDPTLAEDAIREGIEGVFKAMDKVKGGDGAG